jgi:putative PIN family toxin of toxin-antitoxin system
MIRAVLDTNVIVSGILTPKSVPATILKLGLEGKFKLVISPHVIEEIGRVIRYEKVIALMKRHNLTRREVDDLIQRVKRVALVTPGELEVTAAPSDPADDMVLSYALEGKADFVVSGDHHLTDLKSFQGVSIVNPRRFLHLCSNPNG